MGKGISVGGAFTCKFSRTQAALGGPWSKGRRASKEGGGTEESGLREAAVTRESGRRAPSSEALGVTRE